MSTNLFTVSTAFSQFQRLSPSVNERISLFPPPTMGPTPHHHHHNSHSNINHRPYSAFEVYPSMSRPEPRRRVTTLLMFSKLREPFTTVSRKSSVCIERTLVREEKLHVKHDTGAAKRGCRIRVSTTQQNQKTPPSLPPSRPSSPKLLHFLGPNKRPQLRLPSPTTRAKLSPL